MSAFAAALNAYREIGRNSSLRRVLLAFLLFNTQELAVWIAVLLFAYQRGGTTAAGIVAIAQLVPAIFVAPLGSVLGDRIRRDRALALGYSIQGVATGLLAVAIWVGPAFAVYACAVVAASAVTLTRPVHNAILPDLSETPRQLTAANSASSTVEGLGWMLGPLLNSVLVAVSGLAVVAGVAAVLSSFAALLTVRLSVLVVPVRVTREEVPGIVEDAVDGFRQLRQEPGALTLTVLGGAQFLVLGVLDVFWAALAIEVLSMGDQGAGLLASVFGVGGLVGAGLTVVLVGRRRMTPAIEASLVLVGGALAAVALAGAVGPVFLLITLAGAARSFFDVAARTLLQRSVKEQVLARVFGLQEALVMLSLAVGSALAPLMAALVGVRGAFALCGAMLPVAGVLTAHSLRSLDRRAIQPDPERLAILRENPVFAALPHHVQEQLSWHLFPVRIASGGVVIREGAVGDRFFLIVGGEASVRRGGREVARLGPGGYFGEIALLRNVPRTATVEAVSDLDLLALERWEFLGAVTGSRPGSIEANREIDRRLSQLEAPDPGAATEPQQPEVNPRAGGIE